jgi:hypothetical protein
MINTNVPNKILSKVLESTNLRQADFDPMLNILTVGFVNGNIYEFYGVSPETYQSLIEASSPGKFFLTEIKGKYDYAKRGQLVKNELE